MAVRSLLVFVVLFTGFHVTGQTASEEIRQLLSNQSAAWNRGDIDGFMEGYLKGKELHFLGTSGLTKGWQETLDRYKRVYPDTASMGKLRFELSEVTRRTDDVYTVIGQYFLTRETLEDLSGYFLLVVVRTPQGWRITADSTH